MKRSFVYLIIVISAIGFLLIILLNPKKKKEFDQSKGHPPKSEQPKEAKHPVKGSFLSPDSYSTVELLPAFEKKISFSQAGVLEYGELNLKPGSSFKDKQLLYQLDNRDLFRQILAGKMELRQLIGNHQNQISLLFPTENQKWLDYSENIKTDDLLESLPEIHSKKEQFFLDTSGILKLESKIRKLEEQVYDYFSISEFEGVVLKIYKKPGDFVSVGEAIALLAPKNAYKLKISLTQTDLEALKKSKQVVFRTESGKEISIPLPDKLKEAKDKKTHLTSISFISGSAKLKEANYYRKQNLILK